MSLRADLVAAKALIDTPDKWIKGDWCEGGCYCAAGAARKVANNGSIINFWGLPIAIALDEATPQKNIVEFNDDPKTTYADIMALFDRAIEAAS